MKTPFLQSAAAAIKGVFTSKQSVGRATLEQVIQPNARDRWNAQLTKTYTPARIEQILRDALNGNLIAQHELFDLMEETSARINKNLNQRKRAVVSFIRTYNDWAEEDQPATDEAKRRTKVVSTALRTMSPKADENENGLDETIYDILDATGKGIALIEVDWETRKAGSLGTITAPRTTRWVHPRFYGYAPNADWVGLNASEIDSAAAASFTTNEAAAPRLQLIPVNGVYARIPQNKFLICVRKSKSGSPITGALLRQLAFWWAASNFTQSWFLNFAQIFGLPIRWANYDPNTPGLLEKVCAMLENMGSAAWGAFPSGTTLELKEPPKASNQNPQVVLLDMADKQYDLAILGQSGTTEISGPGKTGGSNAANQVLAGVEEQLVRSDADFVCNIINHQLIPGIVLFNFGDTEMLPKLCLEPEVIEDIAGLVTNYKTATDAGVLTPNADDESHFRKKLSLPAMPKEVEADWVASKGVRAKPPAGQFGVPPLNANLNLPANARAACGCVVHAHAKGSVENEKLVNNTLEQLTGVSARWLAPLKPVFHELIAKAKDDKISDADLVTALAKARDEMPELFHKLDADALAELIYNSGSAAVVNGAVKGALSRGKAVAA